ncbi:MAG TPA: hypothetical protein VMU05_19565 [Dongiaceae bacterium]|nr:hypothetical protein [Dongiaceae bacterium]
MATSTTPQQDLPYQRTFPAPTAGATETVRPPQLQQILAARLLGGEAKVEFLQVSRIIFHRHILGIVAW